MCFTIHFALIQNDSTRYFECETVSFTTQQNKLRMRDSRELTLVFLLNVIGNDKKNYPQKLLLTNTHVSKICKSFSNSSSANI